MPGKSKAPLNTSNNPSPFTGTALEPYRHLFKRADVPAHTLLLREGTVSRKAYFIEKGCIRLWFNNQGKDITFQFFFENEAVSSVESFQTHTPSLFNIETLEPCVLHELTQKDFATMRAESPAFNDLINESVLRRMVFYQKLFLSRIKDNPAQRYAALVKEYPHILQRVPQHYIASYLGITPVSLSRIRNKR
jgi:CRP-like cAMP-binding protein